MLTVEQAANVAKCSAINIRKAITRKKLPAEKFGTNWAIKSSDLDMWIEDEANHTRGPKKRKT